MGADAVSLYDRLAGLSVEISGYALERRSVEVSSGFTRVTTTIALEGGGETGRGEDVGYEAAKLLDRIMRGSEAEKSVVEIEPRVLHEARQVDDAQHRHALVERLADMPGGQALAHRLERWATGSLAAIFAAEMEWERSCILASVVGTMQRQLEDRNAKLAAYRAIPSLRVYLVVAQESFAEDKFEIR